MADLLRLIAPLLMALMWSGVAPRAEAAIPPSTMQELWRSGTTTPRFKDVSFTVACNAAIDHLVSQGWENTSRVINAAGGTCQLANTRQNGAGAYNATISHNHQVLTNQCPANSTLTGGSCICTAPNVENAAQTACEAPPPVCQPLTGQSAGARTWRGTASEYYFCDSYQSVGAGKCVVKADRVISWQDASGQWFSQSEGSAYTGELGTSCTGTGGNGTDPAGSTPSAGPGTNTLPNPGTAAPAPCPTGQAPGSVNGVTSCYPTGSTGTGNTTGPAPSNGSNTVTNPDGTTTTTTTSGSTSCTATTCTTTTTVNVTNRSADGAVTGSSSSSSTSQGSRSSFCAQNGTNTQCAGSGDGGDSSFGGNCTSGFKAVSEDAVVNAMAEEQYRRNCQLFETQSTESQLYGTEKGKTGNQTTQLPGNDSVTIGPGNFDTSDALGGGSCWADKVIPFRGQSVTLKLSAICPYAAQLGNLLVAIALLSAFTIVFRSPREA